MKIFIVLVIYFATRLINILILPPFTDESSYVYASTAINENFLKKWDLSLNLPIVKPPLFFYLTIFLNQFLNNPLLAGRLVSVIAGGFTLLGLYMLTKQLFDKRLAFLTSILYVLSPFSLTYDRLALMDSLMTAFSVWILIFALKFLENRKLIFIFFLFLFNFLALFTKQSGKFFLLLLPLIPLFYKNPKVRNIFFLSLISGFSYIFYDFVLNRSQYSILYTNFDKTYINFSFNLIVNNLKAVFSWIKSYFQLIYLTLPFAILYYFSKFKNLLLLFWFITPLMISIFIGNIFFPRYLLTSMPVFFLIIAYLFKRQLWLLSILLIPSILFDYFVITNPIKAPYHYNEKAQFITEWPSGYGVQEVTDIINNYLNNNKIFVEGDNGHLYSSLKMLGVKSDINPYAQNSDQQEVLKEALIGKYNYLITNRQGSISSFNLFKVWSFTRPYEGESINIYKIVGSKE